MKVQIKQIVGLMCVLVLFLECSNDYDVVIPEYYAFVSNFDESIENVDPVIFYKKNIADGYVYGHAWQSFDFVPQTGELLRGVLGSYEYTFGTNYSEYRSYIYTYSVIGNNSTFPRLVIEKLDDNFFPQYLEESVSVELPHDEYGFIYVEAIDNHLTLSGKEEYVASYSYVTDNGYKHALTFISNGDSLASYFFPEDTIGINIYQGIFKPIFNDMGNIYVFVEGVNLSDPKERHIYLYEIEMTGKVISFGEIMNGMSSLDKVTHSEGKIILSSSFCVEKCYLSKTFVYDRNMNLEWKYDELNLHKTFVAKNADGLFIAAEISNQTHFLLHYNLAGELLNSARIPLSPNTFSTLTPVHIDLDKDGSYLMIVYLVVGASASGTGGVKNYYFVRSSIDDPFLNFD